MKKEYVQYGKMMIIIQVIALLGCLALFFIIGAKDPAPLAIIIFVLVTFMLTLASFYKMTITIDDTHISFSMGIGLIKKSYPLSDIQSCTPVKNSFISGIGIHMTSGGWLYNVSGSYSIQLRFKSSTNEVRLGTDKPDEIAQEVSSRLGLQHASSYFETSGKKGFNIFVIIIPIIIIGAISMVIYGGRNTKYSLGTDSISISGMYGMTVAFSDIVEADTILSLPPIRTRTNGYAAGNVLKGHFRLKDGSGVLLFIKNGNPPYLHIKTPSNTIYLNGSSAKETREIYKSVKNTGR
jgi:hypothetical protein